MRRITILISIWLVACGIGASAVLATGDCSDYTDLTGLPLPITVTGSTVGATGDFGPFTEAPPCWQGAWNPYCAAGGDVTFRWAVPAGERGRYTFTLVGTVSSNADLLLYDFTCPAPPVYPDDFICKLLHR